MKEETTEEKEMIEEAEKETFGSSIDFKSIYRIKGKQGLFTQNSNVNKSKLVNMAAFLNPKEKHTVKTAKLVCLGDFVFHKEDNTTISMAEVFDNINDWEKGSDETATKEHMMEIMVPNYDTDRFKDYHAVKVLQWYRIIKGKIDGFGEEEIVEENA